MRGSGRNVAMLARQHFGKLRTAAWALSVSPAAYLLWQLLTDSLGVNALQQLLRVTGQAGLILLLTALALNPLRRVFSALSRLLRAQEGRRLTDWNWLIRLRRQTGVFAFFYGALHLVLYLKFDIGWSLQALRQDLAEHLYMVWGLMALAIMLPLAATSTHAAARWLGPLWKRLHLLAHAAAMLGVLHAWTQTKVAAEPPWPEAITLFALQAHFWWQTLRRKTSAPAEVASGPVRPNPPPAPVRSERLEAPRHTARLQRASTWADL